MAVFKPLKGDKCTCAAAGVKGAECTCERMPTYTFKFRFQDKQYKRATTATTKEQAEKLEAALLRELRGERHQEVLAWLNGDESRMRRTCATIGEVIDAYLAKWQVWLKEEKAARRNCNDLVRVVATAQNLWTENTGGRRGTKVGVMVPDVARVRALSAGRLTRELVHKYFRVKQGDGAEVIWRKDEDHAAINSTLGHARDVFGRKAREHAFAKLTLPDLDGFLTCSLLPEFQAKPDPLNGVQFAAMIKAADELEDGELALCNRIFRQTGMRSYYVEELRGSWLEEHDGRWYLRVIDRPGDGFFLKEGTKEQFIPIGEVLAQAIRTRGPGLTLLPSGTKTARANLVDREHNAWLKGIIGGLGEHTQGNHRLRETVASALACAYGIHKAQEALGHTDSRTTAKHYAKAMPGVPECMRLELAAWAA